MDIYGMVCYSMWKCGWYKDGFAYCSKTPLCSTRISTF